MRTSFKRLVVVFLFRELLVRVASLNNIRYQWDISQETCIKKFSICRYDSPGWHTDATELWTTNYQCRHHSRDFWLCFCIGNYWWEWPVWRISDISQQYQSRDLHKKVEHLPFWFDQMTHWRCWVMDNNSSVHWWCLIVGSVFESSSSISIRKFFCENTAVKPLEYQV